MPLLEKGAGHWSRAIVARVPWSMPQDSVHYHCRVPTAVNRTMGHTCGNPNPSDFVLAKGDAAQLAVLQHDQIDAATQHHELISLLAVAEQLRLF